MIDTHAHLTVKPLYDNLSSVINNAKNNNVNEIISIGMTKKDNLRSVEIANNYENVFASVGIHPNEVLNEKLDLDFLEELAKNKKVVAIGEIGIDLYRSKDTLDIQKTYFIEQIKLAIKLDLPVIIHSRNSSDVIYEIVKNFKGLRGVMHCYSEHIELLDKYIDLGFYVSVGGIVTFKNALNVKEIALKIPLNRLLIETDAPYLAPVPYRGKTNEPAYVKYTLEELAKIKNISNDELINITRKNTYDLFSKMKR